jgi:hypothetical protein
MKVILPNSTRKVNAKTTNFDYLSEGIMGRPDCSSLRQKDQTLVFPLRSGNGSSRIVCYPERTACIGRHRWKGKWESLDVRLQLLGALIRSISS